MIQKNLNQLIGKWKNEIPKKNYSSSVQLRTYDLYNKIIDDYEVDDIRFMIGQELGLKYLVPLALSYLENDILTEGMYYAGDLLVIILKIDKNFWSKNLRLYGKVYELLLDNKEQIDGLNQNLEANKSIISERENFLKVLM